MIAATLLALAFTAGALAGVAALLRLGIARDESRRSLRAYPATRSAAATRRVLGLYASMPPSARTPHSPARPAEALRGHAIQALPRQRSPRQLPAPRPGSYRDGIR